MKNSVTIKGFLPKTDISLAELINAKHKKVLELYGYDVPSNNTGWYSNPNVIGFYAIDNHTQEILCACRQEFIRNKESVFETPFVKGIDMEQHSPLIERLNEFASEGIYSEACAVWCMPKMAYKKSSLFKFLLAYSNYTAFYNNAKNIVGLSRKNLVAYYIDHAFLVDEKYSACVAYSEQKYPSFFMHFNKDRLDVFNLIEKAVKEQQPLELMPYEKVYLHFEEPVIIFN